MIKKGTVVMLASLLLLGGSLAGCSIETTVSSNTTKETEETQIVDSSENSQETNENIKNEEEEHKDNSKEDQENNEEDKNDKDEKKLYISASKLRIRSEGSSDGSIVGSVMKGTPVNVLDEITNEAGEVTWYKIEFENEETNNEGWISAKYTVADRMELLSEEYRGLDLTAQEKVEEYPGNPRVEVKGVYLTIHSAANSRVDKLIEMAKETNINTFVIDVKDDNGYMLFPTKAAEEFGTEGNSKSTIKDIKALMDKLKENNIYTIARIVSFKDPKYANAYPDKTIAYKSNGKPFANRDGIVWLSPHDRQLWEYNIAVAKEAAEAGFNEIQFDYVRFPASNGGKMDKFLEYRNELDESKPLTIQRYLKYAREELSPLNVYISADIYGMVGSVADDMGIGQYWEAVSNVVDYVSPMMYPSHYGSGVYGIDVPDAKPYETIDRGLEDAIMRNKNIDTPAIIRPWIQDFTATWVKGYIKYGPEEIKAQIRALEDNGVKEYLLWSPSNRYSEGGLK